MVPLDPELSCYNFGLDDEDVKEEGMWYAFNWNLEACFKTHKIPPNGSIVFQEHGTQLEGLVKLIKIVVKGITNDAAIVSDALGVAVHEIDWHAGHCVSHTRKDSDHHGLVATTEEEDIWAWNDGEKWGDELPEVAKEENWFYLPMWHTFSGSYQPSVTCDHLMN